MIPKKPQKTVRFGIEFELFTLNERGFIINGADRLIRRVRREFPSIEIKEECAKSMIEIVTPPHTEVPDAVLQALKDFQNVITCAAKEKMVLYAHGTYPGEFNPRFRAKRRYQIQQEIFGKQRFSIAGRCIGLHIHYSLPWGVFNSDTKSLKPLTNSKNKDNMLSMYNLAIAMDPVLVTLTQSSPFYQGKREGKDARALMYRGGAELKKPEGLYANYPDFGALPRYEATNADILHLIADRAQKWKAVLRGIGRRITSFKKPGAELTTNWSPVRINQHGTIELRGMDMNHPDIVVATAILIKFIFKAVQEKHLAVIASDSAITRPWRYDGESITIPPSTYVRNELQPRAAYQGLADEAIYNYASALLDLAKNFMPAEKLVLLKPFDDIIRERKSASDRIIEKAKRLGYDENKITPDQAAELALDLSSDLYNEVEKLEERLEEFIDTNKDLERTSERGALKPMSVK